jgi:hypothetical protein
MLHMTLHLTRSSLWTFQLLRFEVFQVRLQKSHFNRFYRDFFRFSLVVLDHFLLFTLVLFGQYFFNRINMWIDSS